MAKERLDKLISSQSMMTRSDVSKLLKSGGVTVNGTAVKSASLKADPETDRITVGGKPFLYKKHIYIMLHKPAGIVSASRDPKEKTVVDLVPEELLRPGLFPAGRLDRDTTGFVLITDDGGFAHAILSPKRHVEKTYLAETEEPIAEKYLAEMRGGMTVGEDRFLPAQIDRIQKTPHPLYKIVLHEGKYHQIKRMLAASEVSLLSLKRVQMGQLALDGTLRPGECREITKKELALITKE